MHAHAGLGASSNEIRRAIAVQVPEGNGGKLFGYEKEFLLVGRILERRIPAVRFGRTDPGGGLAVLGPIEKLDPRTIEVIVDQVLQPVTVEIEMSQDTGVPAGLEDLGAESRNLSLFSLSTPWSKEKRIEPAARKPRTRALTCRP